MNGLYRGLALWVVGGLVPGRSVEMEFFWTKEIPIIYGIGVSFWLNSWDWGVGIDFLPWDKSSKLQILCLGIELWWGGKRSNDTKAQGV